MGNETSALKGAFLNYYALIQTITYSWKTNIKMKIKIHQIEQQYLIN